MRVDQLMSRDVVTVAPDAPLKDVARVLARDRISGVPVCDADGKVLGVVSEADILWKELGLEPARGGLFGWLLDGPEHDDERIAARTARDAMTAPAIAVAPHATVAEAAALMVEARVNRLPVVDGDRLVGIVARADLVRAFRRSDEEIANEIDDDVLLRTLWIDPDAISLVVLDGEVTLGGVVENRTTAELVSAYVRRVPGVVAVHSNLTWTIDDQARATAVSADTLPRPA